MQSKAGCYLGKRSKLELVFVGEGDALDEF